jgi:hypothetical protein
MKIKGLLALLFITFCTMASGQDLLVNFHGDSLNVKIGSVDRDKIYYSQKMDGRIERQVAYRDSVVYFERNFYKTSVISKNKSFERLRIGLTGGGGLQTGDFTLKDYSFPGSSEFTDKLRWGWMAGIEGAYYFNEIIGIGIRYNHFSASSRVEGKTIYASEWVDDTVYVQRLDTVTGTLQEKVGINFLGPEVTLRITSKNQKFRYNTSFAFGVMLYHNDYILGNPSKVNGVNIGMDLSFCPEMMISKNLALGLEASFLLGSVNQYTMKSGDSQQTTKRNHYAVSMSRLDLGLSLKWIH